RRLVLVLVDLDLNDLLLLPGELRGLGFGGLGPYHDVTRVVVAVLQTFLEVPDALAEALADFGGAPGSEEQLHDDEHDQPVHCAKSAAHVAFLPVPASQEEYHPRARRAMSTQETRGAARSPTQRRPTCGGSRRPRRSAAERGARRAPRSCTAQPRQR